MFGIDEGGNAALFLEWATACRARVVLPAGFRPVNFDHAPPGQSADTQRLVQRQEPLETDGILTILRPQPHDGAFAELAFNLGHCRRHSFFFIRCTRHKFLLV
jgi:hypothetical protein